jgi:hypothetical protein
MILFSIPLWLEKNKTGWNFTDAERENLPRWFSEEVLSMCFEHSIPKETVWFLVVSVCGLPYIYVGFAIKLSRPNNKVGDSITVTIR